MLIGPRARDADASSWQLPRLRLANMELITLLQVLAAAAPIGGGDITQPSAKGHTLDSQPWSLATTSLYIYSQLASLFVVGSLPI